MKCLRPDCKKDIYARGLCFLDYQSAARLVRKGKTTWRALERSGKATVRNVRGNKQNASAKWLLSK